MSKLKTIAAALLSVITLREGVKLARASGHFEHRRIAEWIEVASREERRHDHPDVVASLEANDGRYIPAYRDDDGNLVEGLRWVGENLDSRDTVVLWKGDSKNVKTTVGIDFLFAQGYSTSTGANGLNYIALSNDTLTETSASTTLSTEIASNGLTRAQGTYAHTTGASTSTISKTFTATGSQSCQKAALFTASSSGTMNHALSFTQRSLVNTDQIAVTFTITLS